MNYCKDCGHFPEGKKYFGCRIIVEEELDWHTVYPASPACRKFSAKKRTCGECVHPHWRALDDFGICTACFTHFDRDYCPIGKDSEICDNFKREATRKTCGGTAERGM